MEGSFIFLGLNKMTCTYFLVRGFTLTVTKITTISLPIQFYLHVVISAKHFYQIFNSNKLCNIHIVMKFIN